MNLPNFLIIGETKCGTTSLYEDLVKHPQILPSLGNGDNTDYKNGNLTLSQKEIRFFDRYWDRGIDWYKNCFSNTKSGEITGEASPTYLYRSLSMRRIKEILPSVKLIIMLRNPIDRLYSHFHHIAKIAPKWKDRYPTFECFIRTAHENDYYIIDKSIYIKSLRECARLFSKPGQIIVVKSENIFNNSRKTYADILKFLNLSVLFPEEFSSLRQSGYTEPINETTKQYLSNFYDCYNRELYEFLHMDMEW